MKFNCNQNTLSKALNTVSKAVTTRTTIPVLKGFLLKATSDNKLTLSSSDLDFSIETVIDVDTESEGSVVVNAKLFNEIIKKLVNERITVELKDNFMVNLKTPSSEFSIVSQNADDFPNIPEIDNCLSELLFDKQLLKNMIKQTQFCAGIDDTKGIIVGLLMELTEESFNMVAIDGYRMAVRRENVKNDESKNIIIDGRILNEVSKILSETEDDEEVKLLLGEKYSMMILENTRIVMRLLEGEFIDYKSVLPKESSTNVIINRNLLIDSIERASLLAREGRNNLIRIKINENLMTITSNSEEGKVKEEIIMEKEGDNLEIGFNSKYILAALKAVDDEEIKIELTSPIKHCLIKPVKGENYEYLILPVRISAN